MLLITFDSTRSSQTSFLNIPLGTLNNTFFLNCSFEFYIRWSHIQ